MSVRFRAALLLLGLLAATRAEAVPAFARKYGMSCSACHVAWPVLNQQGQVFRDNGYQLGLQKDDPSESQAAYVPLSIRSVPAYQFDRTTNQPGQWDSSVVRSGGFAPIGLDVIAAGTFGTDVSYLAVLAGFASNEPAVVESAWARVSNLAGTPWLNLRIGKFEAEVPISGRRGITRTTKHAVHKATFKHTGSTVAFRLHDNQAGFELEGHDERSLTRYSLALMSADSTGSRGPLSAPVVYGHLTRAFELDSDVLSWMRVGAFGALGWQPTRFATTDGTAATVIPGTGRDHRKYARYGAELAGTFGSPSTPFHWTAVYMRGQEEASAPDVDPAFATVDNGFNGGYLELIWVPYAELESNATPWAIFGRYDVVRYEKGKEQDYDGVTAGVRRLLAIGARASMGLHFEVHGERLKGTGFDGGAVLKQSALVGADIAF